MRQDVPVYQQEISYTILFLANALLALSSLLVRCPDGRAEIHLREVLQPHRIELATQDTVRAATCEFLQIERVQDA